MEKNERYYKRDKKDFGSITSNVFFFLELEL
jgi:hypothetical protein